MRIQIIQPEAARRGENDGETNNLLLNGFRSNFGRRLGIIANFDFEFQRFFDRRRFRRWRWCDGCAARWRTARVVRLSRRVIFIDGFVRRIIRSGFFGRLKNEGNESKWVGRRILTGDPGSMFDSSSVGFADLEEKKLLILLPHSAKLNRSFRPFRFDLLTGEGRVLFRVIVRLIVFLVEDKFDLNDRRGFSCLDRVEIGELTRSNVIRQLSSRWKCALTPFDSLVSLCLS